MSTAFLNEDGSVAVVVMNPGEMATKYFLWVDGNAAEVNCRPHSIATLVFKLKK
jgi:glucosylceramidase